MVVFLLRPIIAASVFSISQIRGTLCLESLHLVFYLCICFRGRYELFHTLQAHNGYILKCQTSSNGRLLATCSSDKTAKIWNIEPKSQSDPTIVEDVNETSRVAQFELIRTLQGHQRWVWDCAFSAVSSYLVTCSSDQSARLWDLCQGEAVRHYNGHHKAVICVALNDSVAD